jgi:AcrR family transcriptional regulator
MAQTALRGRQMELTRDLILEALGYLVGEGHLAEFSVQDVADRAGVSLRTVYRHFASREALLEGFVPWAFDRARAAGAVEFPARAEDIAPLVRQKFGAFEGLAPLVIALAKLDSATGIGTPVAARSVRTIRSSLSEVTAGLDPELAEAVVWMVRIIWSHKTWAAFHEEGGLDSAHAGAAAAWAIDVLINALREGRGPTLTEGG